MFTSDDTDYKRVNLMLQLLNTSDVLYKPPNKYTLLFIATWLWLYLPCINLGIYDHILISWSITSTVLKLLKLGYFTFIHPLKTTTLSSNIIQEWPFLATFIFQIILELFFHWICFLFCHIKGCSCFECWSHCGFIILSFI